MTLLWILVVSVLLVAGVILEGKRQERRYGKPEGRSLIGTGMLELQRHLQADRKVEILIAKQQRTAQDEPGDQPRT